MEPDDPADVDTRTSARDFNILKGGLLWLIGIPIPVILIVYFFTNWLN